MPPLSTLQGTHLPTEGSSSDKRMATDTVGITNVRRSERKHIASYVIAILVCAWPSSAAYAGDWHGFLLAPAFSSTGAIKAVSRIPGSMELWWIGPDGSVWDANWYEGGAWYQFQLAPPGSASTTAGIAAVSRVPYSMELWWVGPDGSVQDASWYEGGSWTRFQLAAPGSASTSSGIAAVSRVPYSMEVWWVGPDGSVQDAFWYEGGSWNQLQLVPPNSAASAAKDYQGITAVSRIPNSLEVWWVGADGSVWDANWYEGGFWNQFQLAAPGSADQYSAITAVSRIPTSMELWWVGVDGSVWDANWYEGGFWNQFQLAPSNSALSGSGITAVSRIPNSLEVWWSGPDPKFPDEQFGAVQDAYWYEGGFWNVVLRQELEPPGHFGFTAVSRIPTSMEIWYIGSRGAIFDGYWYDTSAPDALVSPSNAERPSPQGGRYPWGR